MPNIMIYTNKKVETEKQIVIKDSIQKIVLDEMGKEKNGLFISFISTDAMYREGVKEDEAGIIDMKYIGNQTIEEKRAVTVAFCKLLRDELALNPRKIIVLIDEKQSDNWGRRFGDF